MALRLRGATSGYIELKAPASAGDNTLTLPTNNGSANQLLKTDGSGNLSWTNDNSGVSLSGSTNNTIATVTGANALQGEGNLTFDGTNLNLPSVNTWIKGGGHSVLQVDATMSYFYGGSGGAQFRKADNSSALIQVLDDGKVGIGITSPSYKLDILEATGNGLRIKAGDATADIALSVGSAGTADKFVIQAGGNVGIGTASPSATAISSNTVNGVLHIDSSGADSASVLKLGGKDGSSNSNYVQLGWAGANNRFDITVNGNQALRVEADKDVTIVDGDLIIGTAGHGIDFSDTAGTGTSELLDDYEEGTFTPTNSIGLTLTNNTTAHYTKIGRLVHIQLDISFSGSADTSQCAMIQSLPFTSMAGNVNEGAIQFVSNTGDAKWDYDDDNTRIFIAASESRIDIKSITNGTAQTRAWAVGRRIRISMNYLAA